jgi:phage terminase large subunit-like protein
VWAKVNPSIGITIQMSYLQQQVNDAQSMPQNEAMVKRLNFCLWTETHQVWIPADRWDACKVAKVVDANPDGRPCAAGLDLSSKWDLSGLTIAVRFDDAPSDTPKEVVEIEGMEEATGERTVFKFTLDFTVDLIPYAWIPEETLIERVDKERIPYNVWQRTGKLFVTPGPVIDHQAIYDFIIGKGGSDPDAAWNRFRIQRLGYDDRDATMLATAMRDKGRKGEKIVAVGQGKKLSEALKLIMVLVRARRLRHDGHPVLAWCVANSEPKEDRLGAIWIEKPNEIKRIDLAVGAAMAMHQLMLLPQKRPRSSDIVVI